VTSEGKQGQKQSCRPAKAGLLRSLVVAPAARNPEFGRELVGQLEADAREHGIHHLVLLTEAAAKCGISITLFRLGWLR
jgi:N-acetylglutamate synthase-like GNAT family acetyltransferase